MKIKLKHLIAKIPTNDVIKLMYNDSIKYFKAREFKDFVRANIINRNAIVCGLWVSYYMDDENQKFCPCLVVSLYDKE